MKILGRVITNNIKDAKSRVLGYIDVSTPDLYTEQTMPTLIVGHDIANYFFGKENVKVLNKKIKDNIYWTFARNEKRNEYEKDIKNFNDSIFNRLKKSIKYEYLDIFNMSYSSIKNIFDLLRSFSIKYYYVYNDHIYLYSDGVVYGLSLNDTRYLNISDDKIFKLIENSFNIKKIENNGFLGDEMLNYIGENNIIIPYLYQLNN